MIYHNEKYISKDFWQSKGKDLNGKLKHKRKKIFHPLLKFVKFTTQLSG